MNRIGCGRGIGGALRHALQGESFIRHIGNDKLILDFHEGSGTTIRDKSHCGNDGTFGAGAAAPTWRRNSLYFDGGDYVILTGITHGISTGEFTFCFSVDGFGTDGDRVLYDQETIRLIVYRHSDKITLLFTGTFIYLTDVGIGSKPTILQITRDTSGNIEAYVNGIAQGAGESNATDESYDGVSKVKMGSNYSNTGSWFIGTMYSFRILNKGLSGIESQQEYLANKFSNN